MPEFDEEVVRPDAWKYEVKTETSEKEFWHEVWQKTPTALKKDYVRNEVRYYSAQKVKEMVDELADQLSQDMTVPTAGNLRDRVIEELSKEGDIQ